MKFTLCIDYKAATGKGLEYIQMNATKILDAISEADGMWNDEIYMMQIMEKEGKTERMDWSRVTTYRAVLARRSYGWHLNNKQNSEAEHKVTHTVLNRNSAVNWYETVI